MRPEAWVLAGLYALWIVWGRPLRQWVRAGAIVAVAPVVWALSDLVVTGDPLYSLNYTTESAAQLGRRQSLDELPGVTLRYLAELVKPPVLLLGAGGIVLAWRMAREKMLVPATLLVWGVGMFLLISLRGFRAEPQARPRRALARGRRRGRRRRTHPAHARARRRHPRHRRHTLPQDPAYGPFDQSEDSPRIQVPPAGSTRAVVGRRFTAHVRCAP